MTLHVLVQFLIQVSLLTGTLFYFILLLLVTTIEPVHAPIYYHIFKSDVGDLLCTGGMSILCHASRSFVYTYA